MGIEAHPCWIEHILQVLKTDQPLWSQNMPNDLTVEPWVGGSSAVLPGLVTILFVAEVSEVKA